MTTGLLHSLEIGAGSATLYLAGRLAGSDVFALRRLCREIPHSATNLRLDLHAVTALDAGAMDTIRALVRYWRETRNGACRLSLSANHLVAADVDTGATPSDGMLDRIGGRTAALTGMFL